MNIVKLDSPIQHGDEELTELCFRAMTTEDINRCGYPLKLYEDGGSLPQPQVISALISRLAKVPPSVVNKISPKDYNKCLAAVLGFLGDAEAG